MRPGIVSNVTGAGRRWLEGIVVDRGEPQTHLWRANIILAAADGNSRLSAPAAAARVDEALVAIELLGNKAEVFLSACRVLPWQQSDPGSGLRILVRS